MINRMRVRECDPMNELPKFPNSEFLIFFSFFVFLIFQQQQKTKLHAHPSASAQFLCNYAVRCAGRVDVRCACDPMNNVFLHIRFIWCVHSYYVKMKKKNHFELLSDETPEPLLKMNLNIFFLNLFFFFIFINETDSLSYEKRYEVIASRLFRVKVKKKQQKQTMTYWMTPTPRVFRNGFERNLTHWGEPDGWRTIWANPNRSWITNVIQNAV